MPMLSPKRDGLMAVGMMLAALTAALGYYLWGSWQTVHAAAVTPLPALPDLQVPEDTVLNEMARLGQRLNRLAYPRTSGAEPVHLQLFGYTPASSALRRGAGTIGNTSAPPAQFDYALSFALAAGSRQLCLLDGQLYARGAILPDGGQIQAIETERVLIEKPPLQRWIYLQEPEFGRETSADTRGSIHATQEKP